MSAVHHIDRTNWPAGPWDNEPDRLEWRSEGFACLIVRNTLGALCGYVGMPDGHPWHGVGYDDVGADVHGGLTYADKCRENTPICHVPQPGESDSVWWLGFDCIHGGDAAPGMMAALRSRLPYPDLGGGDSYKGIDYVRAEVESLVQQAKAAS